MKPVQIVTVTPAELANLLIQRDLSGATPASISCLTDTDCRKTGCPYKRVSKLSHMGVMLGFSYQSSVNRERDRECQPTDFVAKSRRWGVRVSPSVVEHKGNHYVSVKVQRTLSSPLYYAEQDNGLVITVQKAQVEPFLPVKKPQGPAQGVQEAVIIRDIALSNVRAIQFGRTRYVVRAQPV